MTDARDWTLQYCDDAVFVPAPADAVFAVLLDAGGWNDWWTVMRFEVPHDGPVRTGDRIVFDGGVSRWTVEVGAIDAPRSIALRYVDGALVGDVEWRVDPAPGGCRAAYVYHGVRACEDRAAATFGRFGTRLHTMVMQADALPGLVRRVAGEPTGDAWRESVRAAVAAGREALILAEGAG